MIHVLIGILFLSMFALHFLNTKKLNTIMEAQNRIDAALVRLDAATNEIASDLKKLRDQIVAGTVTQESLAKLEANIAKLESLGAEDGETGPDTLDGE